MPALTLRGRVDRIDYGSANSEAIIDQSTDEAAALISQGYSLTLFGSSYGANLLLFVLAKLRKRLGDQMVEERITVRLDDSPMGGQTMKGLPELLRRFMIRFPSASTKLDAVGGVAMKLMRVPPKDKNIKMPSDTTALVGRQISSQPEFNAWVKAEAIKGLTGHPFSRWYNQVAWMCRVGDTLPTDALRNLRVVYVACDGEYNDTVHQPLAVEKWLKKVENLHVLTVKAPHCSYLESNDVWLKATADAYDYLGVPI